MAYIDCDKCYHGRVCAQRHHYHDMIVECNHHIPTSDVVEVVRCKKCENCKSLTDQFDNVHYFCMLSANKAKVEAEGFCSYGERRDT